MVELSPDLNSPLTQFRLHVTFVDKDGDEETFVVAKGDNLLDIAQANDVEMEGIDFGPRNYPNFTNIYHRGMRRILCMLNMPCHS